jgi:formylmethanofuran dehydrogenase subunit E-like metal-binding protein
LNQLEYVELEPSRSESGKAVFHTPAEAGVTNYLALPASASTERGRVEKARRWYYWGWGGTWITGITAMLAYGLYTSYDEAFNMRNGAVSSDFNSQYSTMNYIYIGSLAVAGLAVAHEIFQMVRYINIANKDATPYVKTSAGKRETQK